MAWPIHSRHGRYGKTTLSKYGMISWEEKTSRLESNHNHGGRLSKCRLPGLLRPWLPLQSLRWSHALFVRPFCYLARCDGGVHLIHYPNSDTGLKNLIFPCLKFKGRFLFNDLLLFCGPYKYKTKTGFLILGEQTESHMCQRFPCAKRPWFPLPSTRYVWVNAWS